MSKKIIAALIALTLLFIGVFAACKNNSGDDYEPPKVYLDGDEYPFYTNENGERLLDENGEFIVFQTEENGRLKRDENGDPMTMPQAFEAYSVDNVVEDYGYRITLPENWVIDPIQLGAFNNTVTGDRVTINVYDKTYQDAYYSNFEAYEKLQQYDEVTVAWEENVTDLGEECEGVIRFTLKTENGMNVLYIFRNHGNIYKILFESKNPATAVSESVAICKAISYKPYDYFEPITDEKGNEVADEFVTQPISTEASQVETSEPTAE